MLITLTFEFWLSEAGGVELTNLVYGVEDASPEWMRKWWRPGVSDDACAQCGVPFVDHEYVLLPYTDDSGILHHTGHDMCLDCAIYTILGPDVEIPEALIARNED